MKRINEERIIDIIQDKINRGDIFIVNRGGISHLYNKYGVYLGTDDDMISVHNTIMAIENSVRRGN